MNNDSHGFQHTELKLKIHKPILIHKPEDGGEREAKVTLFLTEDERMEMNERISKSAVSTPKVMGDSSKDPQEVLKPLGHGHGVVGGGAKGIHWIWE